jgi:hypothetical protein
MAYLKNRTDVNRLNSTLLTNLTDPIILEEHGQPVAVLISLAEYEQYQALRQQQGQISADEARRLANRAVFADLVGCALSSGQPIWRVEPTPHWQIPYRSFKGTLLHNIKVDAVTGKVSLTPEERANLLAKVERLVTTNAP